ncbi:hypothetical protein Tco_0949079 [Tanacetum coccineum]
MIIPRTCNFQTVRMTRGELALASHRHMSTRGWSTVTGAVAGATGQQRSTVMNHQSTTVSHRQTTVAPPLDRRSTTGPPVNGGRPLVNGGQKLGPKNINEALKDESWVIAMQEELNQFISNDVWELVPNPKDMTIDKYG